jgi:hypothetical protein
VDSFWDFFLLMFWFFLWVLWLMLLFRIITDIFRSHDLSGWGKAGWLTLVIVVPFLGVFAYLIARGGKMHERQAREAWDNEYGSYNGGGSGTSRSDQLSSLADLRDRGILTEEEFRRGKEKVLQS